MPTPSATNTEDAKRYLVNSNPAAPGQPVPSTERRKHKNDTRWKQQQLSAYRIRITFLHALIYYLVVGVLLIAVGVYCYVAVSLLPKPIVKDYTDCRDVATSQRCADEVEMNRRSSKCHCAIEIEIDESLTKPRRLIFFYELTNFHQNIRSYKKDFDESQMGGHVIIDGQAVEPSARICKDPNRVNVTSGKFIFPCGKIANSYFSDVFRLLDEELNEVSWSIDGIAWESDKRDRFKKPKISDWKEITDYFDLPKDWHDEQRRLFKEEGGIQNDHFIVWVRVAALKTFRKKYAYIAELSKGKHTVEIDYRFDAASYNGRKKFMIAADPGSGPTDLVLFYSFIAVGCACLLVGPVIYLVGHFIKSAQKKRGKASMAHDNPNNLPLIPRLSGAQPHHVPQLQSHTSIKSASSLNIIKGLI